MAEGAGLDALLAPVRRRFRQRVAGTEGGVPAWAREIALSGPAPGWFEPDGVVWGVHGDLATLVGGITALMGQACHPLALAGVEQHSSYRQDPWARLAGTARWLVVTTFGSAQLAQREATRVRAMHERVVGTTSDKRPYAAGDPRLLRWVHLAFTDAFLAAHRRFGTDLSGRHGRHWDDTYVAEWAASALALGALDLPVTARELDEAIRAEAAVLEQVPARMRTFLAVPPGLGLTEAALYLVLARGAGALLHPSLAGLVGALGRDSRLVGEVDRRASGLQLAVLRRAVGPGPSPGEQAARYRLGLAPAPPWLSTDLHAASY